MNNIKKLLFIITLFISTNPLYSQGFRAVDTYQTYKGKIVLNATVEGQRGKFILDTGAPFCLTQKFYNKLGKNSEKTINFEDSNGANVKSRILSIDKVNYGGVNFIDVMAAILPQDDIITQLGLDGIIGYTMFGHISISIDAVAKQVIFTADVPEKIKSHTPIKILENKNLLPMIGLKLSKDNILPVMFDIGANSFLEISNSQVKDLESKKVVKILEKGYGAASIGAGGIEQNNQKYRLLLENLNIGELKIDTMKVETTNSTLSRIGIQLLKYANITIDYPNKNFYLIPTSKNRINLNRKDWDITITSVNNQLIAGIVWGKLAEYVSAGEQIVGIDGKRFDTVDSNLAITTNLINLKAPKSEIILLDSKTKKEKNVTIYYR